jgi:CheY-like chemotaxis protein
MNPGMGCWVRFGNVTQLIKTPCWGNQPFYPFLRNLVQSKDVIRSGFAHPAGEPNSVVRITDSSGGRMSKFVVLLVEDDTVLREALADLLKDEGFEVIECATGEAAEVIIATTGTELRAVVADHNLAGEMTGATLASYALHLHPGMNIVIMSGTMVNLMPANAAFLQKPFPMMRLLEAIRR